MTPQMSKPTLFGIDIAAGADSGALTFGPPWNTVATNVPPPPTAAQIYEAVRKLDAIRNPHRDLMLVASDRLEELGDAAMAKALREAAGE